MVKMQPFATCLILLVSALVMHFDCFKPIPFNVTSGFEYRWSSHYTFTSIGVQFEKAAVSGTGVHVELDDLESYKFNTYSMPSFLRPYEVKAVIQLDMQKVDSAPYGTFTFSHDYIVGILNVNPKEMLLTTIDTSNKAFVPINFETNQAKFTQQFTFPTERKIYTIAIMGITKEIPSQFQVDTLVNYRASIRYETNKYLNQYLSAYVNRPLNYPPHNYIAKLIDNKVSLPSNQMVEIISFSFNPMFARSFVFKMVMDDFMFQFDISKGFVDRNGNKVAIDYKSLKCLYIVEGEKGFLEIPHSNVNPERQQLVCNSGIGRNNFFPTYITIVANRI